MWSELIIKAIYVLAKVEDSQLLDNPVSCKSMKTEDGAVTEPDFGSG